MILHYLFGYLAYTLLASLLCVHFYTGRTMRAKTRFRSLDFWSQSEILYRVWIAMILGYYLSHLLGLFAVLAYGRSRGLSWEAIWMGWVKTMEIFIFGDRLPK